MGKHPLLLDFGNSCLKVRLDTENGRGQSYPVCYEAGPDGLEAAPLLALQKALDREGLPGNRADLPLRIASVLSPESNRSLANMLAGSHLTKVRWARVAPECHGLRVGYTDPETLGVDRWLGFLAAWTRYTDAVLVVDVGSAVTVDLVDATGQHLGGVIAPGFRRMAQGLLNGTDLPGGLYDAVESTLRAGSGLGTRVQVTTEEGIGAGLIGAVTGLVELHFQQAAARLGKSPRLILTGGDAEIIRAALSAEVGRNSVLEPDLVLDGLLSL